MAPKTTTNEAAERLRQRWTTGTFAPANLWHRDLDEALAAERRVTVARMQRETQRAYRQRTGGGAPDAILGAMEDAERAILDEEAAR